MGEEQEDLFFEGWNMAMVGYGMDDDFMNQK
jgi:hypothetical protein